MKIDKLFSVAGKVTLVTGAASGLGLSMAEAMAENGAITVMADIDAARLGENVARLTKAGARVEALTLDVADTDAIAEAVRGIVGRHGRLDVAFANAGVTAGPGFRNEEGKIENSSLALWDSSLKVNLTGAFATMQAAAGQMKRRGSGSIIVTTSAAAFQTTAMSGYAYHAAKAALAHLVRLAAKDLGPSNVRVNGIAPGPFATNIAGGRLRDPAVAKIFTETVPLGRMGRLDEVQGLALMLASEASSYITGAVIPVDGGTLT